MRISDWSSDVCSSDLEHPDAAFPDPFLPRMPDAHVLLPRDRDAADREIGEPGECGLDRGGLARMPGGVEPDIARRRRPGDRLRLDERRRRGLFAHAVQPRRARSPDRAGPAPTCMAPTKDRKRP